MIVSRWWQAGYPAPGGAFLDMLFYKQTLPLTPAELQAYARRFPKEHTTMATWSEQLIEQGRQ